jgi:hypothetical protein
MSDTPQPPRQKCDAVLLMPLLYNVEPETFESLWFAGSRYGRDKIKTAFYTRTCVWKARDRLARNFLRDYDAERAIFCDGDMGYPTGNAQWYRAKFKSNLPDKFAGINFFERMMSYGDGYDIVGAAYFDRLTGSELQCGLLGGQTSKQEAAERWKAGTLRGLHECDWVGSAGMMIKRHVFEAIAANLDKFPEIKPKKKGGVIGFFTPNAVDVGEDVAMALRARELGFKVWVDCDLKLAHKGAQFF